MKTGYMRVKRVFDLFFALLMLFFLWPLMLLIALRLKLQDRGPVFFRQERPGYKARPFYIYKFRTMTRESYRIENGKKIRIPDRERITPVGSFLRRTSLDELPQLINIIAGEMSFIGPRPLLMEYLTRYNPEQARRHDVMPGISGLAQVSGRNAITWDEKFVQDIYYVDNISFALDLKILFLTIKNVLKRTGIDNSADETMPFFE